MTADETFGNATGDDGFKDQTQDFISDEHRKHRRFLSRTGDRVEVNVFDSSDIRAAIEELRRIQSEFEEQLEGD